MLDDQQKRVLLIEDNQTDVQLIQEALREHGVQFEMTVIRAAAPRIISLALRFQF